MYVTFRNANFSTRWCAGNILCVYMWRATSLSAAFIAQLRYCPVRGPVVSIRHHTCMYYNCGDTNLLTHVPYGIIHALSICIIAISYSTCRGVLTYVGSSNPNWLHVNACPISVMCPEEGHQTAHKHVHVWQLYSVMLKE